MEKGKHAKTSVSYQSSTWVITAGKMSYSSSTAPRSFPIPSRRKSSNVCLSDNFHPSIEPSITSNPHPFHRFPASHSQDKVQPHSTSSSAETYSALNNSTHIDPNLIALKRSIYQIFSLFPRHSLSQQVLTNGSIAFPKRSDAACKCGTDGLRTTRRSVLKPCKCECIRIC